MTMLSLIARAASRARCSPSAFRSTKPYLHQQLPTYAYSMLRFDNDGSRDTLSSHAGKSQYYGGRHSQPLLLPQVAVAALAAASATAISENKTTSLCQGDDIASRDEESVQHPNAGAAQQQGADLQQPQQSNGFKPHPDAWVRPSLKGQPQMEAWLALMNEVGHFFPAKGVSKEIGKNSKLIYSDWVVRFVDWHNAKYGTGQPAHLAMPSGIALGAEEAERARTAVPRHLTVLPPPSLRLLVEWLEAMFVSQPAGGAKPYSRVRHIAKFCSFSAHNFIMPSTYIAVFIIDARAYYLSSDR